MLTGVNYIRNICKSANIPIALLEKDCGFANGYLNPKKLKKIPYERALAIVDFFKEIGTEAKLEQILGASVPIIKPSVTVKSERQLTKCDEHDIEKIINATIQKLMNQEGLTIDNLPVSTETIESIIFAMRIITEMVKEKARKDKKY